MDARAGLLGVCLPAVRARVGAVFLCFRIPPVSPFPAPCRPPLRASTPLFSTKIPCRCSTSTNCHCLGGNDSIDGRHGKQTSTTTGGRGRVRTTYLPTYLHRAIHYTCSEWMLYKLPPPIHSSAATRRCTLDPTPVPALPPSLHGLP